MEYVDGPNARAYVRVRPQVGTDPRGTWPKWVDDAIDAVVEAIKDVVEAVSESPVIQTVLTAGILPIPEPVVIPQETPAPTPFALAPFAVFLDGQDGPSSFHFCGVCGRRLTTREHEIGHVRQWWRMGPGTYDILVILPSLWTSATDQLGITSGAHSGASCEKTADHLGHK